MTKIVTVIGATGTQGGSVVRALLKDKTYSVRAVTRTRESEAAKALSAQGVALVEANLDDIESLKTAFAGSYAIFGVTNFFASFPAMSREKCIEVESAQGLNIAKAASGTETLKHFIWSTLPNSRRISGGKIAVPHYEGKNMVDAYIKSDAALYQKTTFLLVSFYSSNLAYPFYKPMPISGLGDSKFVQLQASPASVLIHLAGDVSINIGLYVQAILDKPGISLPGKAAVLATDVMTAGELLAVWASVEGKVAYYVDVGKSVYYDMWPAWGKLMDESHMYWAMAGEDSFAVDGELVTKEDLGIEGLVDTASALSRARDANKT